MKNLVPFFILKQFSQNIFHGEFQASTMFVDISGFTKMTDQLMENGKEGAEVLSQIMNSVFTPAINSIYKNKGFVSTFGGDSFNAIFQEDVCLSALEAAAEIRRIFTEIGYQKTRFGNFHLSAKIGISYGLVQWGITENFSDSSKLRAYYFKGFAIDNCSRCEKQSVTQEIVFDLAFYDKIKKESKLSFRCTEFTDDFFRLDHIVTDNSNLLEHELQTSFKDFTAFFPDSVLCLEEKGEFRDVVSCFISFEETNGWQNHVSNVINLVSKFGGYFNRISFGDKGGFLLVFFGAPTALEKSIQHSLDFLLEVQQMENFNTRAGLTFGKAFAGFAGSEKRAEYTCNGSKVNLAARLMMKANFGDIYFDESINGKISKLYENTNLQEMEFKNIAEKITVFKLTRKNKITELIFENKLIGRKNEQQRLKELIQPVYQDKFTGVIYVNGAAGIGKSRLIGELKRELEVSWFYLPCDEILRDSFNPLIYFLNTYFEQSLKNNVDENKSCFEKICSSLKTRISLSNSILKDEIVSEFDRTKSILGSIIGLHWKNSLFEQLTGKARYENTLLAFKNLVKAESLISPVVIELEDGMWIDPDTKNLLQSLTKNIDEFPIAIISSCRFNQNGSEFSFGLRNVNENRINLEQLSQEGSEKLIADHFKNHKVPLKTSQLILEKSEGNPFYIEQIILYLKENQLLDEENNINDVVLEIPSSISSIIINRVDRLTSELKDVVKMASVLGRQFSANILSNMLSGRDISRDLHSGQEEKIWDSISELTYIFKHALIREAVYEMQLKEKLRSLHQLAAETIESIYKSALEVHYHELANHYEKSENIEKVIEYLQKAGSYASKNFNNEQANSFYKRLIFLVNRELDGKTSKDTQFRRLLDLKLNACIKYSVILQRVGEWAVAKKLLVDSLETTKKNNMKSHVSRILSDLGHLLYLKGDNDGAMDLFNQCLSMSKDTLNSAEMISIFSRVGAVHLRMGELQKAMDSFQKWLTIAEEERNEGSVSMAFLNIGIVHFYRGNLEQAQNCYQKRLEYSEKTGNLQGISYAIGNIGIIKLNTDSSESALECFYRKLEICKRTGNKMELAATLGNIGIILSDNGNYQEAMELINEKLKISLELGDKPGIAKAYGSIGNLLMKSGEYDKAIENTKKCMILAEEIGDTLEILAAVSDLGIIHSILGNFHKSLEFFKQQLELNTKTENKTGMAEASENIADVYFKMNKFDQALDYYEKAIEFGKEAFSFALLSVFVSRAICFYELLQYSQAQKNIELGYSSGDKKEEQNEWDIFRAELLQKKIEFRSTKKLAKKLIIAEKLNFLVTEEDSEEKVAMLNYESAMLFFDLKMHKKCKKACESAVTILKSLYEKTPMFDYKVKIEKLEQLLENI